MKTSIVHEIIYNLLLKTVKYRGQNKLINRIWTLASNYSTNRYKGPVTTKIHGFKVIVNNGFSYPFYARLFPKYNNPLIQLVFSVHAYLGRKVSFIDVGSAVGDTNLLLIKNLPETIEKIYCIEGDLEFYEYLNVNKKYFPDNETYNVLLGDSDEGMVKSLVKTHLGTASSIGLENAETISLDKLLYSKLTQNIDIIKIDVDGFDGKVLNGCSKILSKYKPYVIFEWHPILLEKTNNSYFQHFEFLKLHGYNRFLWFTKYGEFSHFDFDCTTELLEAYVKLCLRNNHDFDWHYDIIAIHKESTIDIFEIAEMKKAKAIKSRF